MRGFRRDDRVYVWGRLDEQWVKCVGTIVEPLGEGAEFTVAFDGIGEMKGDEARMHGSSLHHLGAESMPPCAKQREAFVKQEF